MMKNLLLILFIVIETFAFSQEKHTQTALVLIDIQYFYYPGGASELYKAKDAGLNAQKLLMHFRKTGQLVIHVKHHVKSKGDIHHDVKPIEDEKIISKNEVNAFKRTDLLEYLTKHNITDLVLIGMQTHMCLEAATRAACDYGFKCTVVEDACTTKDLKFGEHVIKAMDVHYSTLATLESYAKITTVKEYLSDK